MTTSFFPRSSRWLPDRGQTGIDFIIGVGIFLLTIAFVFSFVPGTLAPFGDDTADPVVADRIADELVYQALAGASAPSVLDERCTLAFFGYAASTDCHFDGGGQPGDWLAVPPRTTLNVTVEKNLDGVTGREVVCLDAGTITDCTSGGDRLAYGSPPPQDGASVATASRVVSLGGTDTVVMVRLW